MSNTPKRHAHSGPGDGGDEVRVGKELKVPIYSDNANAVQEDRSIWYNDGTNQIAGFYGYDGSAVTGPFDSAGAALSDSGSDNADGGDQYVFPQAEDSIDLQGTGDIENAASVTTDEATINSGTGVGIPTSTTSPSLSLGTWRQPSTSRPTKILVEPIAQTDGTNAGSVDYEVDLSGGTTPDWSFNAVLADPSGGSGYTEAGLVIDTIPPSAQYRFVNDGDPNNFNNIPRNQEMEL